MVKPMTRYAALVTLTTVLFWVAFLATALYDPLTPLDLWVVGLAWGLPLTAHCLWEVRRPEEL